MGGCCWGTMGVQTVAVAFHFILQFTRGKNKLFRTWFEPAALRPLVADPVHRVCRKTAGVLPFRSETETRWLGTEIGCENARELPPEWRDPAPAPYGCVTLGTTIT